MTKQTLQSLYDTCNWQGYATYRGKRIYTHEVLKIAKDHSINLIYNCPA